MESRKMVLMNLLAEKGWRRRCRERTCDPEGEGERGTDGESGLKIDTLSRVN